MEVQTFNDVFEALSDTPAEAADMRARADLMSVLVERVTSWGLSREAAAARLGITRPRLNDLLRGKLGKFSPNALVNLAAARPVKRQGRSTTLPRARLPKARSSASRHASRGKVRAIGTLKRPSAASRAYRPSAS